MVSIGTAVAGKIRLRLVLPCALLLLVSSIDRANVSFASLQMNAALGLSSAEYGIGAGIFFVGYLLGQLPSVFLLQRFGMRRWAAGVTILWGIAATGMAFITSPMHFYLLRIVLGLAESGLAAGIMLYLSHWAAERERASILAVPIAAIPLSLVIGGPLSGVLLNGGNPLALEGWRWMFLVEGAPAVLLGLVAFAYFPDRQTDARWLSDEERDWLNANGAVASLERKRTAGGGFGILTRPQAWLCGAIWFCLLAGNYGVIFWLPQALHGISGLGPAEVGFVVALPWLANIAAIWFNARHSDATGERYVHIGVAALVAAAGLVAALYLGAGVAGLIALVVAGAGLGGALAPFWAIPPRLLPAGGLAVGITLVNIMGSASGLLIPPIMGQVRDATGNFVASTWLLAAIVLGGAVLALVARAFDARTAATADAAAVH